MGSIVAIIGRPNVGKSTLFNRLSKESNAIVDATAGVTRDRHYGTSEWNGKKFTVIDTGGYITGSEDEFEKEIQRQVLLAIEEADAILFVVDTIEGVTPFDEDVAVLVRKNRKKCYLVANKVDNSKLMVQASEFYALGLGEVYAIAAVNGSGTGDLLDDVVKDFEFPFDDEREDDKIPRIAVVGKPNVGKSSFINELVGEHRNAVTSIPGTTRDAIDTKYNKFGHDFIMIDTAGIRKKSKVHENLEFYSVLRSIRAIEKSDICVIMIDALEGIGAQDMAIFSLAVDRNKGVVIVINKWDLVKDKSIKAIKEFEESIRLKLAPFKDVPIIFISVKERQRVLKVLDMVMEVDKSRNQKIATHELNDFFLPIIAHQPPPAVKGKYIKIKYITQLPVHYPAFVFFCNLPQYVADHYKRFLENKLREKYNYNGTPITIYFRQK